jgi:hypothetical protein
MNLFQTPEDMELVRDLFDQVEYLDTQNLDQIARSSGVPLNCISQSATELLESRNTTYHKINHCDVLESFSQRRLLKSLHKAAEGDSR